MSLYRGDETSGTGTSVEDLISGKVNRTGDTMTGDLTTVNLTAADVTASGTIIGLEAKIGNVGTEGSGINIGGTTYESSFKVSDIDGTNYAQTILHRHSTTLEPLIVGARSNSNTVSHTDVTNSQNLFTIYAAGWAGSNYKLFGSQSIGVASTGTVSNTSAPGAYSLKLSPDGSTTLAEVMSVSNTSNLGISYINSKRPFNYPINLNGNFQVAQAGTSFAAPASGAYDLDGARQYNNTAAVYTVTQGTGSQAWKKARITTITTADASVAAGDIVIDDLPIEGYDIVPLVGNTFIVSFNAKFPVTGIHCVTLRNTAADRSFVHEVNCTAANTWASYSFTVTGGLPSTGTWVYTNTAGLALSIVRMAGTTYTGTPATADTWMTGNYLTTANQVNDCATIGNVWALEDVRIDLGSVPGTDWSSYQENLARCQRYYYRISSSASSLYQRFGGGKVDGANDAQVLFYMPVPMRSTPTISSSAVGTFIMETAAGSESPSALAVNNSNNSVVDISFNGATSTVNGFALISANNTASAYIEFLARL